MIVSYRPGEIDRMSVERCRELREQIKTTVMMFDSPEQRRDTFRLLAKLDRRVADAPASAEDRAASAREFLHPNDKAASARAWDVAVSLYGSAKEAKRRGYRDPSEAA